MKKGKKHMDISMRSRIEFALATGNSIRTIARDIDVSLSTVSREIKKHTYESFKGCYGRSNLCVHRATCKLSGVCKDCPGNGPHAVDVVTATATNSAKTYSTSIAHSASSAQPRSATDALTRKAVTSVNSFILL